MSRKWAGLSLLSAAFFLLGIPVEQNFRLSWFGLLPLFFLAAAETRLLHLFLSSLLAWGIYAAYGLSWLLLHKAWAYFLVLLIVIPALPVYFLLLGLLFRRIKQDFLKIALSIFLWMGLQKIYLLTPIGSLALEAAFYAPLPLLQIASVMDASVLSVLFVGLNASLAVILSEAKDLRTRFFGPFFALLFVSVLGGIYLWGKGRLETPMAGKIPVAVIQHNLPYSGRWRLEHPIFIRAKYRELALEAAKGKPKLIVFPLYNFPEDILRNPAFFLGLARETKTPILAASHIPKDPGGSLVREGYLNVAVLYSPRGKILGHHQSIQAAPFGDVTELTGKEYRILKAPLGKLGILLCYEDVVPWVAGKAAAGGAEILVALSNPGQFEKTHQPSYHLFEDQLRAIETGRWLLRASANGYSAVIDSRGKLIKRSRLGKEEILFTSAGRGR